MPCLLRRPILGQYELLMKELSDEDDKAFKNFDEWYLGLEPAVFRERMGPRVTKDDT